MQCCGAEVAAIVEQTVTAFGTLGMALKNAEIQVTVAETVDVKTGVLGLIDRAAFQTEATQSNKRKSL